MKTYIIRNNKHDNWYWAIGWGWMEFRGGHEGEFTIFSEEEREDYMDKYVMPDDGYWEVFFDDEDKELFSFNDIDDLSIGDEDNYSDSPFNDFSDDDIDDIYR